MRRNTTNVITESKSMAISRETSIIILAAVCFLVIVGVAILVFVCGVCDRADDENLVVPLAPLVFVDPDQNPLLFNAKPRRSAGRVDLLPIPLAGPVGRGAVTANNGAQLQLQRTRAAWMSNLDVDDDAADQPPTPLRPNHTPGPPVRELSIRLPTRPHVQDMSEAEEGRSQPASQPNTLDREDPWGDLQQSSFIVPMRRAIVASPPRDRRAFQAEQARLQLRDSHYGFDNEFDDQLMQAIDPFDSDVDDEEYNGESDHEDVTYLDIEHPDQPPPHFEEPYRDVNVLLNALTQA
jgi:hypothetical protein